jgi:hypothetical protein
METAFKVKQPTANHMLAIVLHRRDKGFFIGVFFQLFGLMFVWCYAHFNRSNTGIRRFGSGCDLLGTNHVTGSPD